MQLTVYGKNAEAALDRCESEIRSQEARFSVTLPNSGVSKINSANGEPVSVDRETIALLKKACSISEQVDGAFDITIHPLVTLWGFHEGEQHVPSQAQISASLARVDYKKAEFRDQTVTLPADMQIDLGGIAKGYCGEQLRSILQENGITSALLTLGGNVEAIGTKPDGSAWRIAIRDPHDEQQVLGIIEVTDRAVVTAGSYQRYFEQDGIRYHHILDPKTGYPADSGLCSVTVVSKSGTLADALSTAFFVLGTEPSLALLDTPEFSECEAIFVKNDGSYVCTAGIRLVE